MCLRKNTFNILRFRYNKTIFDNFPKKILPGFLVLADGGGGCRLNTLFGNLVRKLVGLGFFLFPRVGLKVIFPGIPGKFPGFVLCGRVGFVGLFFSKLFTNFPLKFWMFSWENGGGTGGGTSLLLSRTVTTFSLTWLICSWIIGFLFLLDLDGRFRFRLNLIFLGRFVLKIM